MSEKSFYGDVKSLFFMPSFYGAFTWGVWLILYALNLVRIDECSYVAMLIYILVELMFLFSLLFTLPKYHQYTSGKESDIITEMPKAGGMNPHKLFLVVLHTVGFIGLAKYIIDFSRAMGGFQWFLFALMNEAAAIRAEAAVTNSVGTQIGYAGWIAIGFTFYYIAGKRLSKWWLIPAALQLVGNLAYIDKTKPLMILITSLLMMLPPSLNRLRVDRILKWMVASFVIVVITFWLVSEWGAKTFYKYTDEATVLPGITYDIYCYGVSGFAYFNQMMEINEPISYKPVRTFYPLLKFTNKFGINEEPPSQAIEFYDVPFETNVGTFLEPWYRDGGVAFVFLGILLFSFGFDYAGLYLLNARNPYADYAWANLCMTTLLAFITNKIVSFPLWIFCGIGFATALIANQNFYFRKIKSIDVYPR
jgi:oligosaccharide repeat unit polymerase